MRIKKHFKGARFRVDLEKHLKVKFPNDTKHELCDAIFDTSLHIYTDRLGHIFIKGSRLLERSSVLYSRQMRFTLASPLPWTSRSGFRFECEIEIMTGFNSYILNNSSMT